MKVIKLVIMTYFSFLLWRGPVFLIDCVKHGSDDFISRPKTAQNLAQDLDQLFDSPGHDDRNRSDTRADD